MACVIISTTQFLLQQLTFVNIILLITVFDSPAIRGKFSGKNTPKFTTQPELGRTNPAASIDRVLFVRRNVGLQHYSV
jgi:hypothetical protein